MFEFYEREFFFCNRVVTAEVTDANWQEEGQNMRGKARNDRSIDRQEGEKVHQERVWSRTDQERDRAAFSCMRKNLKTRNQETKNERCARGWL